MRGHLEWVWTLGWVAGLAGAFLLGAALVAGQERVGAGRAGPAQGTSTATPTATRTATPPPACGVYWRGVSSPNAGTGRGYLQGVAAVTANDVWAVGYYDGGAM